MTLAEQLCDRVAFMVEGQIPLIDSPQNLKEKYGKRLLKVEYSEKEIRQNQVFELENLGQNESFLKLINQNYIQSMHTRSNFRRHFYRSNRKKINLSLSKIV